MTEPGDTDAPATRRLVGVDLSVLPSSDEEAAQVVEVLTRTAVGLALDGMSVQVRCTPYDHDPDDD